MKGITVYESIPYFLGYSKQYRRWNFCCVMLHRIGLEKAKKELAGSIQKGIDFIRK